MTYWLYLAKFFLTLLSIRGGQYGRPISHTKIDTHEKDIDPDGLGRMVHCVSMDNVPDADKQRHMVSSLTGAYHFVF